MIPLPIESERLVVRALRLEDADEMGHDRDWIREKIDRAARDGGMSLWAVEERATGRAVGLAGLQWEEIDGRRELDLGCVIAADRQRLGYGTEASRAVLAAAFAAGYPRVTAMALLDNGPARTVLDRLGMPYLRDVTWENEIYALYALEAGAQPVAPVR